MPCLFIFVTRTNIEHNEMIRRLCTEVYYPEFTQHSRFGVRHRYSRT